MAAKKKSTKKVATKRKSAPASKAAPANCMAVARENRRLKAQVKALTASK